MKCSTPPLGALHASVLKEHFEDAPQGTDSTEISKIKTCAHHFLVTKRKLTLFHKPSTFVLSVPRVARGRASRSVLMRGAFCHVWMKLPVQLGAGFMMVPKNLHQKGTASVCLETGATEDDEAAHGEVDKYISDASDYSCANLSDFCHFWKSCEKEPNMLAMISKQVLCTPMTSASSERKR